MGKEEYLVSVVVPAYNHEKYILNCLESIHHQTYRDFQWIVVDDCSNDNTPAILKENQSKYGYELILHNTNMGISYTMTEMIRDYAKGKYISPLSSDDMYMPNKVKRQLEFMEANPQYGMCYSRNYLMDVLGNIIGKEDGNQYKSGWVFKDILSITFHPGTCIMLRKDVLKEVGYYKSGVIAEDLYMNCQISERYQIGFLDEYLGKYRCAPIETKRDPWTLVISHKDTIDRYVDRKEYSYAIKKWRIHSAGILSSFTKYKPKAFVLYCLSFFYISSLKDIHIRLSILRNLLFRWKKL